MHSKGCKMEIERKFLLKNVPPHLDTYPHHQIEQAYICTDPVIRVRKEDNDCYLTYKSEGMMARKETNLSLKPEAYEHLKAKADGNIISKKRYLIELKHPQFKKEFPQPPSDYTLTVDLDVFEPPFAPLIMAEVEFGSQEAAIAFIPPEWFGEEVTYVMQFHNSFMAETDPFDWHKQVEDR